jgi:hypothetical protein
LLETNPPTTTLAKWIIALLLVELGPTRFTNWPERHRKFDGHYNHLSDPNTGG